MCSIDFRFQDPDSVYPLNQMGGIEVVVNDRSVTEWTRKEDNEVTVGFGHRPLLSYQWTLEALLEMCSRLPITDALSRTVSTSTTKRLELELEPDRTITVGISSSSVEGKAGVPSNAPQRTDFVQFCEAWVEAYQQIPAFLSEQNLDPEHPHLDELKEVRQELIECLKQERKQDKN